MKKVLLAIVLLLLLSSVFLWVMGKETREIKTEIEIAALPDQVWSMLLNVEQWADWSPIIKEAHGKVSLGSELSVTMISKEGKSGKAGPKYKPVIIQLDEAVLLHWRATMGPGFVMTNDKVFELEATDTGTRVIHKELFSGMMVPLFWGGVEKNVPSMLDSMNEALKELVEAGPS